MEEAPKIIDDSISSGKIEKRELSPRKKFEVLLGLFGTEKAKDIFLENCKNYLTARATHEAYVNLSDTENYHPNKKVVYSTSQRANFHNLVMDTIKAIAIETKNPNNEHESVLRDFSSRERCQSYKRLF